MERRNFFTREGSSQRMSKRAKELRDPEETPGIARIRE
jgi:hypothetical protein